MCMTVITLDAQFFLKEPLQNYTNIFHKWKTRMRVGVSLVKSLEHKSSVLLVLNIKTVLTLPPFHVNMDSTFDTIKDIGDKIK